MRELSPPIQQRASRQAECLFRGAGEAENRNVDLKKYTLLPLTTGVTRGRPMRYPRLPPPQVQQPEGAIMINALAIMMLGDDIGLLV